MTLSGDGQASIEEGGGLQKFYLAGRIATLALLDCWVVRGLVVWESSGREEGHGGLIMNWGLSTLKDHLEGFHHPNLSMLLDSGLNLSISSHLENYQTKFKILLG